jgi:hypothetical protein
MRFLEPGRQVVLYRSRRFPVFAARIRTCSDARRFDTAPFFAENDLDLDSDMVYAVDHDPAGFRRLLDDFPGRAAWVYREGRVVPFARGGRQDDTLALDRRATAPVD